MKSASSSEVRTPADMDDWHDGMVEALVARRAAARDGTDPGIRYLLMTEREVDDYFLFLAQRSNLDRLTMVDFVSAGEAAVRLDYARRVRDKLKDQLSREYAAFHRGLKNRAKDRPPLEGKGNLLAILGRFSDDKRRRPVGDFRACLIVRHWVVHGRYWDQPPIMASLTVFEVRSRVQALLDALPA